MFVGALMYFFDMRNEKYHVEIKNHRKNKSANITRTHPFSNTNLKKMFHKKFFDRSFFKPFSLPDSFLCIAVSIAPSIPLIVSAGISESPYESKTKSNINY